MSEYSLGVGLAWQLAGAEAVHGGHERIEPAHLFIGVCKLGNLAEEGDWDRLRPGEEQVRALRGEVETIAELFASLKLDRKALYREVRRRTGQGRFRHGDKDTIHRSPPSRQVFARAEALAAEGRAAPVSTWHLLAALLEESGGVPAALLREQGVDLEAFRQEALTRTVLRVEGAAPGPPVGKPEEPRDAGPTPFLARYGTDLVARARDGQLAPAIGEKTKREMLAVVRVLAQATKNNPVLVGEPGVGKTAVVEGLACRIAQGNPPAPLQGKRIVQLTLGSLVAGTKYRGEFEARLQGILREASEAPDVVLFIDEIHTVVGAGAAGEALDAANILKPALARGEICCIGATTLADYRKYIERDAALERRFQPITVGEPTPEEAVAILQGRTPQLEAHHQVRIAAEAVTAAVELSVRYLPERRLPDKALDLLDKACTRVTVQWPSILPGEEPPDPEGPPSPVPPRLAPGHCLPGEEPPDPEGPPGLVTAALVSRVVADQTGIPVARLRQADQQRLLGMAQELKKRVLGQDEACAAVAQAVQRWRAGLTPPGRPIGVLLFLGPTGVGKTELAKATAAFLFASDQAMVRLDLSEFREPHTVARLIGAPPGYIGHDREGQLTEGFRRTPHCVVLLDEVEKAHPDVLTLFLQLFDEGRLTDAKGRTLDATNALFLLTANLPAEPDPVIGFRVRGEEGRTALLKHGLRPELVNRLDAVIVFRRLEAEDLARIAAHLLAQLRGRLERQGIGLTWAEAVPGYLAGAGLREQFGAREVRRVIERQVENEIAGMLLREDVRPGHIVALDVKDGALRLALTAGETLE